MSTLTWETSAVHQCLLEHHNWVAQLSIGRYGGLIACPPVLTFTPKSRSTHGKSVYGHKALRGDGKSNVRLENLVWVRIFAAMATALERSLPFFVWFRSSSISPLLFDEFKALSLSGDRICTTEVVVDTDAGARLPFVILGHKFFGLNGLSGPGIRWSLICNRIAHHMFPDSCRHVIAQRLQSSKVIIGATSAHPLPAHLPPLLPVHLPPSTL